MYALNHYLVKIKNLKFKSSAILNKLSLRLVVYFKLSILSSIKYIYFQLFSLKNGAKYLDALKKDAMKKIIYYS